MSHNLEKNKIVAAILVAGIVAMLAGFVSKQFVHPRPLEKAAIDIDTSALEASQSGGGAAATPAGPEPILGLLAKADTAHGEGLAKACLACHDFTKGGPNKIGPNLYGIVNNKKAHKEDFAYSDSIKDMGSKGEHWDYKSLNAFLFKPAAYAKGTKMTFPGFKKAQDRADVIAYLRTLADAPAALPSAADVAADTPAVAAEGKAEAKPASPEAKQPTAPTTEKHGANDTKQPHDPAAASGNAEPKQEPAKVSDTSTSDNSAAAKSPEKPADQATDKTDLQTGPSKDKK